ncbi:c-type cytochrome domain-containing protein, partial [Armatimonas sp.]|uniref:c-type cytochrome domain-containing protein n=1 Tax=Armatimonas sp. TaxID=1872638 RepID=UPI00286C05F4
MRWWMIFVALLATVPSQAQNTVLQRRCVSCHSGTKPAGGLDLSRTEAIKQNASRILRAAESGQMPPSGKLAASELVQLKKTLPSPSTLWSLKPLSNPLPSEARAAGGRGSHEERARGDGLKGSGFLDT